MSCHPVTIKDQVQLWFFISLSSSALKDTFKNEVFGKLHIKLLHFFISISDLQVLATCVAAASAQFGLQSFPNGAVVPVDEPAVAAARADHLAAKGLINGGVYAAAPIAAAPALSYAAAPVSYAAAPVSYAAAPVSYGYAAAAAPAVAYSGYGYAPAYGYSGPLNLNTQLIAHPNGAVVPVDEPAVAAARADHLAIKGQAYAYAPATYAVAAPAIAAPAVAAPVVAAPAVAAYNYGYAGPLNLNTQLVAHPNGAVVPVDEPAVAAARADHLATKGLYGGVYANAGPAVYAAGYAPYAGFQTFPNGAVVPVDEPAVAAARADHLAAKAAIY